MQFLIGRPSPQEKWRLTFQILDHVKLPGMILCCSFFFVYIFFRIMQFDAHDMADLRSAVAVLAD